MSRKSFIIHIDSLDILDEMTDVQAGQLFKAIKSYQNNQIVELDLAIKMAFVPFKNQFVRDEENYSKVVERNRLNGAKPKKAKEASGFQSNPTEPIRADSKNDSDSKSDSKSDSISLNGKISLETIKLEFSVTSQWKDKLMLDHKINKSQLSILTESFLAWIEFSEEYKNYETMQKAKNHLYNYVKNNKTKISYAQLSKEDRIAEAKRLSKKTN